MCTGWPQGDAYYKSDIGQHIERVAYRTELWDAVHRSSVVERRYRQHTVVHAIILELAFWQFTNFFNGDSTTNRIVELGQRHQEMQFA